MNLTQQEQLIQIQLRIAEIKYRDKYQSIDNFFPDKYYKTNVGDPLEFFPRSAYIKHCDFFEAGMTYNQRLFLASNQSGKTTVGGYELTLHTTGVYPSWWKGKRYTTAKNWWVCGKTKKTVSSILRPLLLGSIKDFGSGLIPRECLDMPTLIDAKKTSTHVNSFRVKHISGEYCNIDFKSYEEGRGGFEGTHCNIWLDEEPPLDIYHEALTRTVSGDYIMMITLTPLEGPTPFIMQFTEQNYHKEGSKGGGKYLVNATWEDVPHLTDEKKAELIASYPEHIREARTKGIPHLGSGAVYPIKESALFIDPISIPDHWKRCYALDFGWDDPTAILWQAIDPESGVHYIYAEHYQKQKPISEHASVIKNRNTNAKFTIPGIADPSGGGKNPKDGRLARETYRFEYDIDLIGAENSIEPGIAKIIDMCNKGMWKVFNTCTNFRDEFRTYRRVNGKLAGNDHLMDCWRYLAHSGDTYAKSYQQVQAEQNKDYEQLVEADMHPDSWMYD